MSFLSTMHITFMLWSLKEINLIGKRTLQFIQIMSANGNKGSSPEKD